MAEPEMKLAYEVLDEEGKPVALTPELEMNDHEKDRGAVGMLEWCNRVSDRIGKWGFLPDGGRVTPMKVKVSVTYFEDKKWQTLMDMSMEMGNEGFVKISGKFPITIM